MNIAKLAMAGMAAMLTSLTLSAGAPPSIMFLPDKQWCDANGFLDISERNGKTRSRENYDLAFQKSAELNNVVSDLNGLMKRNGLPAKSYGAASEIDDEEEMEEEAYSEDSQSGGEMAMTNYEALMNKLKPDIIIKVRWNVNKVGFNYSLHYNLEAFDSYSGKSVAQVGGDTPSYKTTVPVGTALCNAAAERMDAFIADLQSHFDDLQTNGREITVACRIGDNGSGVNFNSEYAGKPLSTIISDWLDDNTVNHTYKTRNASRNRLSYEDVRIPFYDSRGRTMAAKEFVEQLQNHLRTLGLKSENTTKGIGAGRLYDICE